MEIDIWVSRIESRVQFGFDDESQNLSTVIQRHRLTLVWDMAGYRTTRDEGDS